MPNRTMLARREAITNLLLCLDVEYIGPKTIIRTPASRNLPRKVGRSNACLRPFYITSALRDSTPPQSRFGDTAENNKPLALVEA